MEGPLREENGDNKKSGRRGYTIKGPQRKQNGENKESGRRGIAIKGPQRENNGDNKGSGRRGYTMKGIRAHIGRKMVTIKAADAEDIRPRDHRGRK